MRRSMGPPNGANGPGDAELYLLWFTHISLFLLSIQLCRFHMHSLCQTLFLSINIYHHLLPCLSLSLSVFLTHTHRGTQFPRWWGEAERRVNLRTASPLFTCKKEVAQGFCYSKSHSLKQLEYIRSLWFKQPPIISSSGVFLDGETRLGFAVLTICVGGSHCCLEKLSEVLDAFTLETDMYMSLLSLNNVENKTLSPLGLTLPFTHSFYAALRSFLCHICAQIHCRESWAAYISPTGAAHSCKPHPLLDSMSLSAPFLPPFNMKGC